MWQKFNAFYGIFVLKSSKPSAILKISDVLHVQGCWGFEQLVVLWLTGNQKSNKKWKNMKPALELFHSGILNMWENFGAKMASQFPVQSVKCGHVCPAGLDPWAWQKHAGSGPDPLQGPCGPAERPGNNGSHVTELWDWKTGESREPRQECQRGAGRPLRGPMRRRQKGSLCSLCSLRSRSDRPACSAAATVCMTPATSACSNVNV